MIYLKSKILLKFINCNDNTIETLTRIITRKINERCTNKVVSLGESDIIITFQISPGLGNEGFCIYDGVVGELIVRGKNELGLLYGAGKLLRTATYNTCGNIGFIPGKWRGTSLPCKEVRGIYFATHFHNFYHDAPVEELERYVEDLALWGYNAIAVWLDMHHYTSIQDPKALQMIERLRVILNVARRIGLRIGLLLLANEAFDDSPIDLRADWTKGHDGYINEMKSYHVELCPSKPGGKELLLNWREEVFSAFSDLKLDYIILWPHDQGGCSCANCSPWGGNGYIKISKPVISLAKQFFPDVRIIVSTWFFDFCTDNEWQGFSESISRDHNWLNYIMWEAQSECPKYQLPNAASESMPLLGFPEISMYECFPWGGFGANPLPAHLRDRWADVGSSLSGGFPYSEGIYEDINKVIYANFYWSGDTNTEIALREYINFEFCTQMVSEVIEAIHLLELSISRYRSDDSKLKLPLLPEKGEKLLGSERYIIRNPEFSNKAWNILKSVDDKLPKTTKVSWRWRILLLRAIIDFELVNNNFVINEKCEDAFEELIKIFHVEDGFYLIRPPSSRNVK